MSFLSGFSDRFQMAFALWPLFSIALTLPIFALLYRRDGRLRFWPCAGAYLIVLYALGLVCFTLYPLPSGDEGPGITYGIPPQLNPLGFVRDVADDELTAVLQIVLNIVLFVPLGFIMGRTFRWSLSGTGACGLTVSLVIELAQLTGLFWTYPHAFRTFDVDDLVWNTAGALLGWGCTRLLARVLPPGGLGEVPVTRTPGFVHRCVAFALDLVLVQVSVLVVGTIALLVCMQACPDIGADVLSWAALAFTACAFLVCEGVVPWLRDGQTPGGGFVRMSIETHERTGARRLVFYLLRIGCLACTWALPALMLPVLLAFFAIRRCMPYDLV